MERVRKEQIAQLKKTLALLNTNLDAAQKSIDALTIRAPMDGQLTALDAEIGQSKPQGAVLGQVDSLDRFKLTAQVDEFYLGRVRAGQQALPTINGREYKAVVGKVYPQVSNGTFKIDLTFSGAAPAGIHNGQAVDLKLELGGTSKAMLLANGPFYQDTGGNWVFVLKNGSTTATRRNVRLGRRNPEYVEVLEGLEPGDRVIVSSYAAYQNIDRVEIESK
jgi:HlyD family secretion protein